MGGFDGDVTVAFGDRTATWHAGGWFTGDPVIVRAAELAAASLRTVRVHGTAVVAGDRDPLAAYAALASFDPDRVRAVSVPEKVSAFFARLDATA